ncbi:LIM domain containing protein, partial [Asbolus verrucosus]
MTGEEITNAEDYLAMATYLTQVYDNFRCEIPHIKHPKLRSCRKIPAKPPIPPKPPPEPPEFTPSLPVFPELTPSSKFATFQPFQETQDPETSEISSSEASQMHRESVLDEVPVPSASGDSNRKVVKIRLRGSNRLKKIKFEPSSNVVHVISKFSDGRDASICQISRKNASKFSCTRNKMSDSDGNSTAAEPDQVFSRVSNWISTHDFGPHDEQGVETNLVDGITDITSITKNIERGHKPDDGLVVEERTDVVKCGELEEKEPADPFIKTLTKFSQYSPFDKRRTRTSSPSHFSVIVEGEELELPETKRSDTSFKSVKHHNQQLQQQPPAAQVVPPRPSSRHKRHADALVLSKQNTAERKTRKRRTLEKIGASVIFRKFLNAFLESTLVGAVLDHENKLPNQTRGNADEDFAARIKNLEDKWKEPQPVEKKPRDLLRAIGKIETSDWNIKEIEKKIRENKLGKPASKDKEKVPKWSKEQFLARQTKMEKQHLERQDSAEAKYADIDKNIKHLELKLKEGNSRDLGQNKVATITEKLASKVPENEPKPIQKSQSRPVILPSQNASEFCHFCGKRVYLMERLSAEGRFFHHGCFKCQYCHTQLRLGSYAFDRDGIYDHKFFCIHHYGMQGEMRAAKVVRKPSQRQPGKSPEKKPLAGIAGVDLLDRVRTPERVEFSNLSVANASSDHEESLSQMDEDEWTDKNFGASAAELGSSDDESSSLSDSDSDDEDAYEEALEEPATKEGTLKWAERFNRRYSKKRNDSESDAYSSSDQSSYYENTSDDDDSDTATEGEEEIRARELRKQEVRVEPPVVQTDTGTDTEVKSSNLTVIPDILSDNLLRVPKSGSKQTCSEDDSADFSSAISGDPDSDDNSPKTDNSQSNFSLAKSATAGALLPPKPPKNFSLPPKEKRKSFGAEFVPKFAVAEPEPLLIIKRTPSKLNLPKEIGKPKVAIGSNIENAKKYFGTPPPKKALPPKPILKRSETVASVPKNKLIKQNSLPEKPKENPDKKVGASFNFDPLEDTKEIDSYIETLLANEEELMKPINPDKFQVQPEHEESEASEEEKISSSIEDLFKALKTETKTEDGPLVDKKIDEKIEDLLNWMDDLEHQSLERKTYRSLSDAKYKNLERNLKVPKRAASVVSRIPKDNIKYFERHLAGKSVEDDPPKTFALARSKTDIYCNRPRTSVDLDAVSNVDIKKVLMKFENVNSQETESKPERLPNRRSFGKRLSLCNLKKEDQNERRRNSENFEEALKDFENFVDTFDVKKDHEEKQDWCVNITVSTIPNPEFLGLLNDFDTQNLDLQGPSHEGEIKTDEKQSPSEVTLTEEIGEPSQAKESKIDATEPGLGRIDSRKQDEDEEETDSDDESSSESEESESDEEESSSESEESESDENDNEKAKEIGRVVEKLDSKNANKNEELKFEDTSAKLGSVKENAFVEVAVSKTEDPKVAEKKPMNIEDMYAKVNKPPKNRPYSPPVPLRTRKKSSEEQPPPPPPRPQRQKSIETPKNRLEPNNNEELHPVAPQRKRAMTSSPLPKRKSDLAPPAPVDGSRSRSTTNLEVKREIVRLKDLPRVVSDESTSDSSSEVRNSATEISTDSEFAHDDPTPTRELPFMAFSDVNVTKTRGSGNRGAPLRKIQVTSGYLQRPSGKSKAPTPKQDIELNLTPLVPSAPSIVRKPAPFLLPRTEGYALNRTQSTGGIAAKVSLELKKKYLLGESYGPGSIQKSGSASTLDTKLKSFHSNISDCQKLLKPAPEISASMQTFCSKLNERVTPIVTPQSPEAFDPPPRDKAEEVFENEPEGRPRSPVHETSIIVPKIDWTKNKASHSEDSLSTDSVSDGEAPKTPEFNFDSIPTVRIDEIPPDSLCVEEGRSIASTEPPKSIAAEKKTLNQPKLLPELETKDVLPEIHDVLHVKRKLSAELETKSVESDADSAAEPATAALTETELSDWARDGTVSDDLDDDDFELNLETTARSNKKPKTVDLDDRIGSKAKIAELEDIDHICGKEEVKNKTIITEALNSVLSKNLDIEFMDTGTETSSDDGVVDSQNGYILFKDEDELAEDSLNNEIVEARNEIPKNTGYCVIANEDNFGGEVIDLKPADLEKLKSKQNAEHDEDSLLILDAGTTTEENTCSDSTVKNLTEIDKDRHQGPTDNNNFQRKRLEEKLAKLKAEQASKQTVSSQSNDNIEFDEHCQRLQSKVEFGNVKDSIDIRKSRRKSKSDSPPKPDLIQEEKASPPRSPSITLQLTPTVRTPDVLYKKEEIEKERDVNQKLVQEMVMNKMKAENKSLERKRRRSRQFELSKSATTDVVSEINNAECDSSNRNSTYSSGSSVYATPDVLLSTLKASPEDDAFATPMTSVRPVSMHTTAPDAGPETPIKENPSLPDVRKVSVGEDFKTPVAPPRLKHEEAKRTAEKLKQEARVRARLLSNEELGLSPEDKLLKLKEKLAKTEKQHSFLHSNEALNRKNGEQTPSRTKSIGEIAGSVRALEKFCRSDPNLLDTDPKKTKKKNNKERERRKSITKLITTFFTKKSPSGNSRGIFSRISPKAKDVSKSCANLDLRDPDVVIEEPVRRKSFSEVSAPRLVIESNSPPPVPPLPLNYTGNSIKGT